MEFWTIKKMIVMLSVLLTAVVVYDIYMLAIQNFKEVLYVTPFALGAFIAMLIALKRFEDAESQKISQAFDRNKYLQTKD